MANADPRDFNRAFEGLDFPASKDAIVRTAADKGGLNGDVQHVLERIPDQTYDTREELEAAATEAYVEFEGLTKGMPVTPAEPAAPAAKAAAAAGAETEDHSSA